MNLFKQLLNKLLLGEGITRERINSEKRISIDFYSKLISPGDLVFDVGANVGSRTRIFLELGANVVAIEPQDACVDVLQGLKNKIQLGKNQKLIILKKVLGESECMSEMMISNVKVLSSLSKEWIDAVKKSGRFSDYVWDEKLPVSMTTLDGLIQEYGMPSFIKIDVEGYEFEVLKGLSWPVKNISLEFTPEYLRMTYQSIEYLDSLGKAIFNYSLGESMQMGLENFVAADELINILDRYKNNHKIFGDIYCKYL